MTRSMSVTAEAWRSLAAAGNRALPREVGGLLLGHYTEEGLRVVAAPVVADPRATRIRYRRDAAVAAQILEEWVRADTTGLLGYVGEWHTHPLPVRPSRTDARATLRLAARGGHEVALLVLALGTRGWSGHARNATPAGDILSVDLRVEGKPQ